MFVLLAFFHPICSNDDVVSLSDEKQLIKYLLEHYEKIGVIGRPVHDTTDTVNVKYGLALIQILDLDEKNQVLTTNAWSRYHLYNSTTVTFLFCTTYSPNQVMLRLHFPYTLLWI
ncbi:hypothetical protein A3Q56_07893 [Intoshia linei]|uniref:Neurotransmitter-gated ion-channel ligand-binding domain-containing protein n=1 Tax=Intoshia linei TaxID=1819745 RepID=A0A177AQV3_9BILA|nr:hypothetical protein A3Q56_07893 [Intoshia linei]